MGRARPLPHQPTREAEGLRAGIEDQQRQGRAAHERGNIVVRGRPADTSAALEQAVFLLSAPYDLVVSDVRIVFETTVTANASNYASFDLETYDDKLSTTRRARFTTASESRYAGRPQVFDLGGGVVSIPSGHALRVNVLKEGTGVLLQPHMIQTTFRPKAL